MEVSQYHQFTPLNKNFSISASTGVFFDLSTTQPITGNDGEIDVLIYNGEPPFTYNWSSNVGSQTGLLITGLTAGTYTLEVIDNNGCTYTKSTILNGTNRVSTYQKYTICDTQFENTDIIGKRGIQQMYNEGFYDLTLGDVNCVVNSAKFTATLNVNDVVKNIEFYTSNGLTDFPSDVFPTPGGPYKHKIGDFIFPLSFKTARYSKIRSFTFSKP